MEQNIIDKTIFLLIFRISFFHHWLVVFTIFTNNYKIAKLIKTSKTPKNKTFTKEKVKLISASLNFNMGQ